MSTTAVSIEAPRFALGKGGQSRVDTHEDEMLTISKLDAVPLLANSLTSAKNCRLNVGFDPALDCLMRSHHWHRSIRLRATLFRFGLEMETF